MKAERLTSLRDRNTSNITGRASGENYVLLLQGVARVWTGFAFLVHSPTVRLSERVLAVMADLTPYLARCTVAERVGAAASLSEAWPVRRFAFVGTERYVSKHPNSCTRHY